MKYNPETLDRLKPEIQNRLQRAMNGPVELDRPILLASVAVSFTEYSVTPYMVQAVLDRCFVLRTERGVVLLDNDAPGLRDLIEKRLAEGGRP